MVPARIAECTIQHVMRASPWLHLFFMVAVAAYLRLPGLGELSLYGDEDYTALAVQGILSGGSPHLPSGMVYWRGAPFSFLAAGSALLFGVSEFSLRLPSAIFGTLTIPIFYALARRLIGPFPAVLAAWLLVFSAWHIDMSRESRMYALFLTSLLITLLSFQRGFIDRSKISKIVSISLACLTLVLHEIGILLIGLWSISLLLNRSRLRKPDKLYALLACVALPAFWHIYQRYTAFVIPGVPKSSPPFRILSLLPIGFTPNFWLVSHILDNNFFLFVLLWLASALLVYCCWVSSQNGSFTMLSAALFLLAIFNLFGLVIFSAFLLILIARREIRHLFKLPHIKWTIIGIFSILAFWIFYGMLIWRVDGFFLDSQIGLVKKILKDSLYYPALHISLYADAFPFMTIIICASSLFCLTFSDRLKFFKYNVSVIFLWFWLSLFALGFQKEWLYLRYTVMLYPFYLMIFAWTVYNGAIFIRENILHFIGKSTTPKLQFLHLQLIALLVLLLIAPSLNEQHSLWAALKVRHLSYNQNIDHLWHGFPFHPDHKSPAKFVKANLVDNDIVIAMDIFQQYYYIGRVDYWLTDRSTRNTFSYLKKDKWFDIYTGTSVITQKEELEGIITHRRGSTVWLITSGELSHQLSSFFPADLVEFLSSSSSNLAFVGQDKETRVYRFEKEV